MGSPQRLTRRLRPRQKVMTTCRVFGPSQSHSVFVSLNRKPTRLPKKQTIRKQSCQFLSFCFTFGHSIPCLICRASDKAGDRGRRKPDRSMQTTSRALRSLLWNFPTNTKWLQFQSRVRVHDWGMNVYSILSACRSSICPLPCLIVLVAFCVCASEGIGHGVKARFCSDMAGKAMQGRQVCHARPTQQIHEMVGEASVGQRLMRHNVRHLCRAALLLS